MWRFPGARRWRPFGQWAYLGEADNQTVRIAGKARTCRKGCLIPKGQPYADYWLIGGEHETSCLAHAQVPVEVQMEEVRPMSSKGESPNENGEREVNMAHIWRRYEEPLTLADLAINGDAPVTLSVMPRHEVASRVWYILEWTGDDGKRHTVEAQTLDLLMRRVNEVEAGIRARSAS